MELLFTEEKKRSPPRRVTGLQVVVCVHNSHLRRFSRSEGATPLKMETQESDIYAGVFLWLFGLTMFLVVRQNVSRDRKRRF